MNGEPRAFLNTAEFRAAARDASDEDRVAGLEETLRRRDAVLAAVCHASSGFLRAGDWDRDLCTMLGMLGRASVDWRAG